MLATGPDPTAKTAFPCPDPACSNRRFRSPGWIASGTAAQPIKIFTSRVLRRFFRFCKKIAVKYLTNRLEYGMIYKVSHGALAQLGAHNTGSVGVRGSNPLCSTKTPPIRTRLFYIYGRLFRCGNKQRLKASAFSFQIPNRFQIEKSRPALLSSGFLLFKYYFSLSEAASTLTGSPTRSSGSFK